MKISIVLPAFNEVKHLPLSLPAVHAASAAFARRGWETEVIVCDNNSTDRTAALAGELGARVVFEPVNQIGRARNTGAAAATGDWLIFIDADSQPCAGLFEEVAQAIESGRVLAGGALIRLDERQFWYGVFAQVWMLWSRLARHMAGSFIFVEAAAFREVGGFSLKLFAGEELELSEKLKRLARARGRRIVILGRHPLLTSARKAKLYTPRENLGYFLKAVFRPRRMLTRREECGLWYDGRR